MRTVPSAGVVRIRYVFTPAPLRGRGYAGAATAAATADALRDGASEVVLFTDLDNPTSNGLYQRLGFQPVQDRTVVTFG
jgi:predicted GNAT family acetyltransferase